MKKAIWRLATLFFIVLLAYAIGRLYFRFTAGFTEDNIASDFSFQSQWVVRPLCSVEQEEVAQALNQPYAYLGKGCQSYVFASRDGKYVIKFFKHQRYRLKPWLLYCPPLPAIVKYRQEKLEQKWRKFDAFAQSWKIAFEHLRDETGLVFVHLNQTDDLERPLILYDKMGYRHAIALDGLTFCLQRRATLLCDTLLQYKARGDLAGAQQLVRLLLDMILTEYARGLADNDHALMQNTGVAEGRPVHIDVGQFAINENVKQPAVFHQEFFTKTYKFNQWLRSHYPELSDYLEKELQSLIGPDYSSMRPNPPKR